MASSIKVQNTAPQCYEAKYFSSSFNTQKKISLNDISGFFNLNISNIPLRFAVG